MIIETIIQKIEVLLKKANYETFSIQEKNKFCFDLLVKKDSSILLIKVFSNIDNLNDSVIDGIKSMSTLLQSQPILIGIKNRYQKLEHNTIYVREDLPFITYDTLEKVIINQIYPYVLARRGGGVVFLDGPLMKELREQKNITRKELSDELNITKRTVSSYETENMRPSQKIAQKILDILEDKHQSIFRNINVFEWHVKSTIKNEVGQELNTFQSHLQDIIEDIGVDTHWYRKGVAPFELSIHSKHFNMEKGENTILPLFSKVPDEKNKMSSVNLKSFLYMFTQLFQKKGIFIVDNDFKISDVFKNNRIPILKVKNLEKIDNESDFIELVKEKEK